MLFKVFAGAPGRAERAQVGAGIGMWARVAGERELAGAHWGVLAHLDASLALAADPDHAQQKEKERKRKRK